MRPPARDEVPAGVSRARTFLPELESLRGIAILLVYIMHADRFLCLFVGCPPPNLLTGFIRSDRTGVSLFLVLSGFLLSLPFLQGARAGRTAAIRPYFWRRALRILPLYWVAVVVGTVFSASRPADLAWGIPSGLFLYAFPAFHHPMPPYSNVWWSLATEVQFYLVLPLLPLALRSRRGRSLGAIALGVFAATYAAYVVGWVGPRRILGSVLLQASLFGRAPLFLAGILAALVYDRWGEDIRSRLAGSRLMRSGGADALLLGLVLVFGCFQVWVYGLGPRRNLPAYQLRDFGDAAGWTAVLLLLLLAPLRAKALLSNRVLARIGILSYSLYLVHFPFLTFALPLQRRLWRTPPGWNLQSGLALLLLTLICLGLCELTYRWIEQPFLVRKQRLDAMGPSAPADDGDAGRRS